MKPWVHAVSSAHKWGGEPEDYLRIHDFLDMSKAAHPDMRHRAMLHHSMGPYVVEQAFGHNLTNSDGKVVPTRDIAEQHIMEDLDCIPPFTRWIDGMPKYWWMGGQRSRRKTAHVD